MPSEVTLTDEQISGYALTTMEPLLLEITSALPTLEELGLDKCIISVIRCTYDKTILKYALLAVFILSAFILFLRFPRFKDFMWLTFLYGFFSLLYFCIYKYCFMKDIQQLEEIPIPILDFIGLEYHHSAIIAFVCTVVFLVIFIAGRKIFTPPKTSEPTPLTSSF